MTLLTDFHTATIMSNSTNHNRLLMAAISSSPRGATSPTTDLVKVNNIQHNTDNKTFVFVEDKMSNQFNRNTSSSMTNNPKRKKKSTVVSNSNPSGVTVFHHHHYQSTNDKSSNNTKNSENPFIHQTNNKVKIEKRKSKSKNGVECVVVKEEIASLNTGDETRYEIGLEDGFTWWSWY